MQYVIGQSEPQCQPQLDPQLEHSNDQNTVREEGCLGVEGGNREAAEISTQDKLKAGSLPTATRAAPNSVANKKPSSD